jgi:hypothetical protein
VVILCPLLELRRTKANETNKVRQGSPSSADRAFANKPPRFSTTTMSPIYASCGSQRSVRAGQMRGHTKGMSRMSRHASRKRTCSYASARSTTRCRWCAARPWRPSPPVGRPTRACGRWSASGLVGHLPSGRREPWQRHAGMSLNLGGLYADRDVGSAYEHGLQQAPQATRAFAIDYHRRPRAASAARCRRSAAISGLF